MGTRSKGPLGRDADAITYRYHDHPPGESKLTRRASRGGRPYARALATQFIKLRAQRAVERKLRRDEAVGGVRHYRED